MEGHAKSSIFYLKMDVEAAEIFGKKVFTDGFFMKYEMQKMAPLEWPLVS